MLIFLIIITVIWIFGLLLTFLLSDDWNREENTFMIFIMGLLSVGLFGWGAVGGTSTHREEVNILHPTEYSISRTDHKIIVTYEDLLFDSDSHYLYTTPDSLISVESVRGYNIYGAELDHTLRVESTR